MKEVTISPKTAFRLIEWLSQDADARARALVNLLSREALGDIKAEDVSDEDNLNKIWQVMDMVSLAGKPTLDKIINVIENDKKRNIERNKKLSERFDLLEALRSQLSVQQWDQMPGALANLKQRLVEAEKSHEVLDCVEERLRNSAFLYPRENTSVENNARWRLASELLMYIKGDRAVCAPADPVSHDFNAETKLAKIRSIMWDSSLGGEVQRLKVMEVLK